MIRLYRLEITSLLFYKYTKDLFYGLFLIPFRVVQLVYLNYDKLSVHARQDNGSWQISERAHNWKIDHRSRALFDAVYIYIHEELLTGFYSNLVT